MDELSAKDKLVAMYMLGQAFHDILAKRALDVLEQEPELVTILASLRLTGKAHFPEGAVTKLASMGLLTYDPFASNYYISDVVEDAIDEYLRLLEESGVSLEEELAALRDDSVQESEE